MFIIEVPYLDLDKTYYSGQCLRWYRATENIYIIPVGDRAVRVQKKNNMLLVGDSEENFYEHWFNYFALLIPYDSYFYDFRKEGRILKQCAVRGKGIRIIKQPIIEVLIATILGYKNPNKTRDKLELIAREIGIKHKNSFGDSGQVTWYEFPDLETILEKKNKLYDCGIDSKRQNKIIEVCTKIINDGIDLQDLLDESIQKVVLYLHNELKFSVKMTQRIYCYSTGSLEMFPQTNFIEEILNSKKEGLTIEKFKDRHRKIFYNAGGLTYHLLAYDYLNQPKEWRM